MKISVNEIWDRSKTLVKELRVRNKQKIFCIGKNKTGTTSLKKAFQDLGFIVGRQRQAELLIDDYACQDFRSLIKYCKSAQVFQDVPFSLPETYKEMDRAFPDSKFILTVRDNADQWYRSLVSFHAKMFGKGHVPTVSDLKHAQYAAPGWAYKVRLLSKVPADDPYNREALIRNYIAYNNDVIDYFINRPNDLLVINLSDVNSYQRLMAFLNIKSPYRQFPWENKTKDILIQ